MSPPDRRGRSHPYKELRPICKPRDNGAQASRRRNVRGDSGKHRPRNEASRATLASLGFQRSVLPSPPQCSQLHVPKIRRGEPRFNTSRKPSLARHTSESLCYMGPLEDAPPPSTNPGREPRMSHAPAHAHARSYDAPERRSGTSPGRSPREGEALSGSGKRSDCTDSRRAVGPTPVLVHVARGRLMHGPEARGSTRCGRPGDSPLRGFPAAMRGPPGRIGRPAIAPCRGACP